MRCFAHAPRKVPEVLLHRRELLIRGLLEGRLSLVGLVLDLPRLAQASHPKVSHLRVNLLLLLPELTLQLENALASRGQPVFLSLPLPRQPRLEVLLDVVNVFVRQLQARVAGLAPLRARTGGGCLPQSLGPCLGSGVSFGLVHRALTR